MKSHINHSLFILLFLHTLIFAETNISNVTQEKAIMNLRNIESKFKENIWIHTYNSFLTHKKIKQEIAQVKADIRELKNSDASDRFEKITLLQKKEESLTNQLALTGEYKNDPFESLTRPIDIPPLPEVSNPFAILGALGYLDKLNENKKNFKKRRLELDKALELLRQKQSLLSDANASREDKELLDAQIDEFRMSAELLNSAIALYEKKNDENSLKVKEAIEKQMNKLLIVMGIITLLFLVSLAIKTGLKKIVHDDDTIYTANKVINISSVTLFMLLLLFIYIENVTYLVTVLGFASAGIAIAIKDWFMSLFGWGVILASGMVKVGDRIKIIKDGSEVVGDVLDISPIRITLYEDITYVTYAKNRRAGRILFLPNNLIFTNVFINYSHSGLKTVWDGIDIMITFDSNHKKASHIIRETAKKYAKGYTDMTRKQLATLRDKYSLKNANVEPRIFTFIEPYGIKISVWYLTSAYATLTLRSTISSEIIDEFQKESDITLAYPTQDIHLQDKRQPRLEMNELT